MDFANTFMEQLNHEFPSLKIKKIVTNKIMISESGLYSIRLSFNGNSIFLNSVLKWGILTYFINRRTDEDISIFKSKIIDFLKKHDYNYSILQKNFH